MRWVLALVLVAGCVDEPSTTVFTGTARRFVVDRITLPMNNNESRAYGLDLNSDGTVDNQLGMVVATLAQQGDVTSHGTDMIQAGVIASSVVVRADSYTDDDTVAVNYFGMDGLPAEHIGGSFEEGAFASLRAATSEPGTATVNVPIIDEADPAQLPLEHVLATMIPDGDGYNAVFAGALPDPLALDAAYHGIDQMVQADPDSHRLLMELLDKNLDWRITRDELANNALIQSLLAPDITVDGQPELSFGFGVHLSPCDAGNCALAKPADACHDRRLDGDESGVDCGGGTCRSCKAGEACRTASDCESNACDAGTCRAAQCNDGIRDGFETDVDCGGPCGGCALGGRCWNGNDCASRQCGAPCPASMPNCYGWPPDFDTCQLPPP